MSGSPHFEKFKAILVDGMDVKPEWASCQSQLGMDMMLDSLDREELAMSVEDAFDLRIDPESLKKLCLPTTTMQDWLDHLDKHI